MAIGLNIFQLQHKIFCKANYQFSFERPNNNGGSNWQDIFFNRNHYNPATSTPVQPTIQTAQTPQATQTAITPENSPNYYASSDLLNLPSNQDIVNEYNKWRKNNPNAAGQNWKMQLANGVTLTEENVNNILNPYGAGRPEGVPAYVPEEVANNHLYNQLLRLKNPNAGEAQLQAIQNRWQPNYSAWLGNYQIGR